MVTPLDPKQLFSFEELFMPHPKGPFKPDEVRLTNLMITVGGPREEVGKYYKGVIEYQSGEKVRPEENKRTTRRLKVTPL
jgi:hypothetical protein